MKRYGSALIMACGFVLGLGTITPALIVYAASSAAEVTDKSSLELDTLIYMARNASEERDPVAKTKLYEEFLERSARYVTQKPDQKKVWLLRAQAALDLNRPRIGWQAGRKLLALGAHLSDEPETRQIMAMLNYRGWLEGPEPLGPQPGKPWENSLGMKFVSVGGNHLAIWETRVQDFETFVKATGHNANSRMYSLGSAGWKQRGATWQTPGFPQTATCPVSGVNWKDAMTFCKWLTEKEKQEGLLGPRQFYRLPTEAEWMAAMTEENIEDESRDLFPWGNQWPPPDGAGNLAGEESRDGNVPDKWKVINTYLDNYINTAPVGSFPANPKGLYDMCGNVWEWCLDKVEQNVAADFEETDKGAVSEKKDSKKSDTKGGSSRPSNQKLVGVLKGGSWTTYESALLGIREKKYFSPETRSSIVGFRCILVTPPESEGAASDPLP